jgi:predicted DNA-binding transcriptional regulator AlpA
MNTRKHRPDEAMRLDPDDLIGPEETAELAGIARGTLASLRQKGEGPPYFKISYRNVRYSRAEVLDWIAQRRVTPGAVRVRRSAGAAA